MSTHTHTHTHIHTHTHTHTHEHTHIHMNTRSSTLSSPFSSLFSSRALRWTHQLLISQKHTFKSLLSSHTETTKGVLLQISPTLKVRKHTRRNERTICSPANLHTHTHTHTHARTHTHTHARAHTHTHMRAMPLRTHCYARNASRSFVPLQPITTLQNSYLRRRSRKPAKRVDRWRPSANARPF
jgi:hypothetical protein